MSYRFRQLAALIIVTTIEPFYMVLDGLTAVADWLSPIDEGDDE